MYLNLFDIENILYNTKGFFFLNTFIYGIIVLILYFLFFKILKKYIKIDFKFISTIFPFLFLSAFLRILPQPYTSIHFLDYSSNFLEIGFYLKTPWFLLLIFIIYFVFLIISIFLEHKVNIKYYNILNYLFYPLCILLFIFILFNLDNYISFFLPIVFSIILFLFIYLVFKYIKFNILKTKINKICLFSQIFDASITTFGLYLFPNILYEKHFVSRFICNISPIFFILLKIFFVLVFIFLVDKYILKEDLNIYFKLIIIILGFLIGFRNLLSIGFLIF